MSFKQYLYNTYEIFNHAGTYTWTKPGDIDTSKPILVHVWGAGGCGGDQTVDATYTNNISKCAGGGGGGLAVKYISTGALGASETITIGAGGTSISAAGGASSFGAHCSATGGNGGQFFDDNASYGAPAYDAATTYSAGDEVTYSGQIFVNVSSSTGIDPTTIANWRPLHGIGGKGIGGDVNRRGGLGGLGHWDGASQAGGGGGGSAPAPYGVSDGFEGGQGFDDAGGGGAGIGGKGQRGHSGQGGPGGGSMPLQPGFINSATYRANASAANGILGYGGNGTPRAYGYVTYGGGGPVPPQRATGQLLLTPNDLLPGGGAGTGGGEFHTGSHYNGVSGSDGAPGAGGGGVGNIGAANNSVLYAGNGGMFGGGGGSAHDMGPGLGGNAAGGGGRGDALDPLNTNGRTHGYGGDGVVIIQYARKV